jgi:hypothetical protein
MRILFDQGTPVAIRNSLADHVVRTAREQGWSKLSNGDLLRAVEDAGFDVLLTTDTNLPYQQNLKNRKVAVVILSKNRWRLVARRLPEIVAAVNAATPGTYTAVSIPES